MKYLTAFVLLSAVAFGQEEPEPEDGLPTAILSSPVEVDPGDLLRFDASDSVGDHFLWLVDYTGGPITPNTKEQRIREAIILLESERFTVIAPSESRAQDYDVDSNGKKIWVPSKAGRVYSVNFVSSNAKGLKAATARARVRNVPGEPPPLPPDGPPPPPPPDGPDLDLSQEAAQWITLVPANVRGEVFKHPISGETMNRQQAVARTFREIGQVVSEVGSFEAIDMMLSIGLAPGFMPRAETWQPFAEKVDAALEALKAQGVTVAQYGQALVSIGAGL